MHPRLNMSIAVALMLVAFTTSALATDDGTKETAAIHDAMKKFVNASTVNGTYYIFDAVEGKLLALKFSGLHEGVASEGRFRASCADFTDQFGRKLDVDFVVVKGESGFVVTEAIVHKIDGNKRPYSLKIEGAAKE